MNTRRAEEPERLKDDAAARNEIRLRAAFLLLGGESVKAVSDHSRRAVNFSVFKER